MLNVAFLTPSLHVGGAERWLISLATHFLHTRPVACVHTVPRFAHPAIVRQAERLMPVFRPDAPRSLSNVRRCVHRACDRADVLVAWGYEYLPEVTLGLDIPVVDVVHSDGAWEEQTRIVHGSSAGADFHVAVSKTALTALPEDLRHDAVVIYNGAELDRVVPRLGRNLQRAAWEIGDARKIALFLGRFAAVKRPQLLLDAMPHLPDDWIAVLLGHGPLETELLRQAQAECPSRCRFGKPVLHVGDAFDAADVLVLPSVSEGMPMVLLEAWLARLPTVVTDFGFVREMHRRHGTLCHATAPSVVGQELAGAISGAVGSPLVEHAQRTAWRHYTAAAMTQRWEEYLAGVCHRWRQHRLAGRGLRST